MSLSLVLALGLLVVWFVLAFVAPVSAGAVHLLLAAGATLLVRWWGETR